ncbi:MAG: hypothetical protein ABSG91_16235 [Syntrophobacteraceae bacterium]
MGTMAAKLSGRSKLSLCIFILFLLCCAIPVAMAGTTALVYNKSQVPLQYVQWIPGEFQLSLGPVPVAAYSELRLNASLNSGPTTGVTVLITDAKKNPLATLDSFQLTPGSSATASVTRVYDIPGQYVMIIFLATGAPQPSTVSVSIFGWQP